MLFLIILYYCVKFVQGLNFLGSMLELLHNIHLLAIMYQVKLSQCKITNASTYIEKNRNLQV